MAEPGSDDRSLGLGAIATLVGGAALVIFDPESAGRRVRFPVVQLHLAAVVVHHHDGAVRGNRVVRNRCHASPPTPPGATRRSTGLSHAWTLAIDLMSVL